MFFYYYIYEWLKHKQELFVVLLGKLTAIDHLIKDHQLDKVTGKILSKKNEPDQLTIEQHLEARLLNLNRNFKGFNVTNLMGEVSRLLATLTEINQRIDGIGLGARD